MSSTQLNEKFHVTFKDGVPILHVNSKVLFGSKTPVQGPEIVENAEVVEGNDDIPADIETPGNFQDSTVFQQSVDLSGTVDLEHSVSLQEALAPEDAQLQESVNFPESVDLQESVDLEAPSDIHTIPSFIHNVTEHETVDPAEGPSTVLDFEDANRVIVEDPHSGTVLVLRENPEDESQFVIINNLDEVNLSAAATNLDTAIEEQVLDIAPDAVYEVVSDGTVINYTCLVCNTAFNTADDLESHARIKHRKRRPKFSPESVPARRRRQGHTVKAVKVPLEELETVESEEQNSQVRDRKDNYDGVIVDDIVCLVWQCGTCDATYTDLDTLTEHQQQHADTEDTEVKNKTYLQLNGVPTDTVRIIQTDNNRTFHEYLCPADNCNFTNTSSADITKHIKTNHPGQKLYKCPKCPNNFKSHQVYRKHYIAQHGKNVCSVCNSRFATAETLSIHEKKCSERVQCEECGELFESRALFNAHRRVHESVTCDICMKRYADKHKLATHLARVHDQVPDGVTRNPISVKRSEPCPICDKTFCNRTTLELHMKGHKGEYDYKCKECGKLFLHKSSLKAHMETHANSVFTCNICNTVYRTSQSLATHKRVIHNPKRYECEHCNRKFAGSNHLNQHLRTHTGEKPYTCETCGLSFAQVSTLRNHIRNVHLKEKRYKCSMCREQFHRPALLEAHLITHKDKKTGWCVVCGFGFQSMMQLREHLVQCHVGEEDDDDSSSD